MLYRFKLGKYSPQFKCIAQLRLQEDRNLHSLIYLEAELSSFVLIKETINAQKIFVCYMIWLFGLIMYEIVCFAYRLALLEQWNNFMFSKRYIFFSWRFLDWHSMRLNKFWQKCLFPSVFCLIFLRGQCYIPLVEGAQTLSPAGISLNLLFLINSFNEYFFEPGIIPCTPEIVNMKINISFASCDLNSDS